MTGDEIFENPGTDTAPELLPEKAQVLVIACGALAREVLAVIRANGFEHLAITCLPAILHNRPEEIPARLREKIRQYRNDFARIFVAYADCGTGGRIEKICTQEGATMMAGPHCYSFYAGAERFTEIAEEEPGSFYLTDYLARHFDSLIIEGFGLNKYPAMRDMMFGNYKRLVYLAQVDDPVLEQKARDAADKLQLAYQRVDTGYGELATFITEAARK